MISISEVERLRQEVDSLRKVNKRLTQKVEYQSRQIQRSKQTQQDYFNFKQRIGCVLAFLRFLREGHYTSLTTSHVLPGFRSSLVHHLFHFLFHQEGHIEPIEISFTTAPTLDTERLFDHLCHYLQLCLSIDRCSTNKSAPSFYYYDLREMHRISAQSVRLVLSRGNNIKIEIILYMCHNETGEFSTNVLCTSYMGITTIRTGVSLYQILEDIYLKQTEYCISLRDLQSSAFPMGRCLSFADKTKFLHEFYQLIGPRLLDLHHQGYSLSGWIPDWRMEMTQECPITSCIPPYPIYRLTCGHELSAMAYKGILSHPVESSESIRCPYCRSTLELGFRFEQRKQLPLKLVPLEDSTILPTPAKSFRFKEVSIEAQQQL